MTNLIYNNLSKQGWIPLYNNVHPDLTSTSNNVSIMPFLRLSG